MDHIENTLRPDTVNEVLLLNRIRQLQIEAYTSVGGYFGSPKASPEVPLDRFAPTLLLAASVEAKEEPVTGLRVTARTFPKRGEQSLGYAYYIPKQDLLMMTPAGGAHMLGHLHQKMIRSLAAHLEKTS